MSSQIIKLYNNEEDDDYDDDDGDWILFVVSESICYPLCEKIVHYLHSYCTYYDSNYFGHILTMSYFFFLLIFLC